MAGPRSLEMEMHARIDALIRTEVLPTGEGYELLDLVFAALAEAREEGTSRARCPGCGSEQCRRRTPPSPSAP